MGLYTVSDKEDKEDLGKKGNVCAMSNCCVLMTCIPSLNTHSHQDNNNS